MDINIDNSQVQNQVQKMINANRYKVYQYDDKIQKSKEELLGSRQEIKFNKCDKEELNKLSFANPKATAMNEMVQTPSNFKGTLKNYQLKGLRWLDNLY